MKNMLLAVIFLFYATLPLAATMGNGTADIQLAQGQLIAQGDNIVRTTIVNRPCGIAIDPVHGRLLVADTDNSRILWWDLNDGQPVSGASPDGVLGQPDLDSTGANRGTGIAADTLKKPHAIAVDAAGNVWVADSFNHRVLRYSGNLTNGMAADLVLGQSDTASGMPNRGRKTAQNSLCCPRGIAIDRQGNVWVADYGNHRVLRFPGNHLENGTNADLEFGQKDFVSSSYNRNNSKGQPSAATLACPNSISVDPDDNVWVSDSGNCRILRYRPVLMNGMAADLVLGQADFKSGNGKNKKQPTSPASLYFPNGISTDAYGLWAADEFDHRVLRYLKPYKNGMDAALLIGQPDLTANLPNRNGAAATDSTLYRPTSAASDVSGNLWVTDSYNNRVTCYRSDMKQSFAAPPIVNGTLKEYYPDRQLKKRLQYRNGRLEGTVREFYENGRLKLENHYRDNILEGIAREFYKDGALKSEVNFKGGVLDGPAYQYTEDGALAAECTFKNGQADGTAREYDTAGKVVSEVDFIDGILIDVKEFNADGSVKTSETLFERDRE
jgi:sugar lactone lactonase YvrE